MPCSARPFLVASSAQQGLSTGGDTAEGVCSASGFRLQGLQPSPNLDCAPAGPLTQCPWPQSSHLKMGIVTAIVGEGGNGLKTQTAEQAPGKCCLSLLYSSITQNSSIKVVSPPNTLDPKTHILWCWNLLWTIALGRWGSQGKEGHVYGDGRRLESGGARPKSALRGLRTTLPPGRALPPLCQRHTQPHSSEVGALGSIGATSGVRQNTPLARTRAVPGQQAWCQLCHCRRVLSSRLPTGSPRAHPGPALRVTRGVTQRTEERRTRKPQ